MTTPTRTTPIGAILSVIGDPLLCDLDDLYRLLEHLLDRPLMTHQMPEAARAVAPWLRTQFPDLAAVDLSGLDMLVYQARTRGEQNARPALSGLNIARSDRAVDDEVRAKGNEEVRSMILTWLAGLAAAVGPTREVGRPDPIPTVDLNTRALNLLARGRA